MICAVSDPIAASAHATRSSALGLWPP